ncbi:hypothetical protein D3C72_820970 [compost metagenome]
MHIVRRLRLCHGDIVEIPGYVFGIPQNAISVKPFRARHTDIVDDRCLFTGGVGMGGHDERIGILAAHFDDIEFRRPGAVFGQEPEGRPGAPVGRHIGANFEISIGLAEGGIGVQHAGGIIVTLDFIGNRLRGFLGGYRQDAVCNAERIDLRRAGIRGVDVPLRLTIRRQRASLFGCPPIFGVPGALIATAQGQRVEFIGKGLGERGSIEAELELVGLKVVYGFSCKNDGLAI